MFSSKLTKLSLVPERAFKSPRRQTLQVFSATNFKMSSSVTSQKSIELYILFSGGIYIALNKTGAYKTSFKINHKTFSEELFNTSIITNIELLTNTTTPPDLHFAPFLITGGSCTIDYVLKQEFDLVNLDKLGINCKRVSLDKFVNNYGNRLLMLCQNLNLLIANGRLGKDKNVGALTCKESSLVDYCILTPELFSYVVNFETYSFTIYT
jgi:hypothetical protein